MHDREDDAMLDDLVRSTRTDLETFASGFPHQVSRLPREKTPVWWHEPTSRTPDGEGLWSFATYRGVLRALNDQLISSSATEGG
jgi:hypothetical protein